MNRSRIELTGPLAVHVGGFQDELQRLGYTASPAKKHFYLLVQLSRWLDDQGLGVADVPTARVEPFFEARRARGTANLRTTKALVPLIAYLRGIEVLPAPEPAMPGNEAERVLASFGTYLTSERGVVEGTARFYLHVARLLI